MAYIKEYWVNKQERAKRALIHTQLMGKKHPEKIEESVKNTIVFDDNSFKEENGFNKSFKNMIITVENVDSVSAVFDNAGNGKIAVLNFASFKNPGGMFIKGSKAQEECLCHESFLYNVISRFSDTFYKENLKMLNRSLYKNRSLYSKNILFHRKGRVDTYSDVITCACPNKSAAYKYCRVSDVENSEVLRSRIDFVLKQAAYMNVNVLILGAYGCGVFGQNPKEVFEVFKSLLETKYTGCFAKVVFAVPDSDKNNNYKVVKEVFKNE